MNLEVHLELSQCSPIWRHGVRPRRRDRHPGVTFDTPPRPSASQPTKGGNNGAHRRIYA